MKQSNKSNNELLHICFEAAKDEFLHQSVCNKITLCWDTQGQAVGEGTGRSQGEDPPPGRHAEESAEESPTHD